MKIVVITLLTCVAAIAQSPNDFRLRYGAPVSESFLVRPGILATLNHAKDGKICSMSVAAQSNPKFTMHNATLISNKVMRDIVDELIPNSQRGKLVTSGFLNLTCVRCESFYGAFEDYEKVRITIGGSSNEKQTASIEWVGVSCER